MMVHRVAFADFVGAAAPTGEVMEKKEDFMIPEEIAEWIGLKKSEYLSKLIENLLPDDFGFEEFHQFDHLINETIETPDKVYGYQEDKQNMRTYMKAYAESGGLSQMVLGVYLDDQETESQIFIPILVFVSRKMDLVKLFCVGELLTHPTLN